MKRLLTLLFFAFLAITTQAQTNPNLPAGSKPFGTQYWVDPDGNVWAGNGFDVFTNLGNWQRVVDSLAIKMDYADTLALIATKQDLANLPPSGVLSVTGDGVDNTDPANPVMEFPTPSEISALAPGDNVSDLANDAGYLTTETDPVWSGVAANYYTKTNLQTSGQAQVHWGNVTGVPGVLRLGSLNSAILESEGGADVDAITTSFAGYMASPVVAPTTIGGTLLSFRRSDKVGAQFWVTNNPSGDLYWRSSENDWNRVASEGWVMDQDYLPSSAPAGSITTEEINYWNEPLFSKTIIDTSSASNARNDQGSIIKLDDGRLMVAYTHFGAGGSDVDESTIYHAFSSDGGSTWGAPIELVPLISEGSMTPSLYKKQNGNILMVFFVREQITPTFLSTLRAVEYSPDMTTVVTPIHTILNGGYYPIAPDRLYYDEANGRLLMPYPELASGGGASATSAYTGGLLISEDEGATWADAGLTLGGKLDVNGFGGVTEPGLFQKGSQIAYYYRNTSGSIYAVDLTVNATTYTASAQYNTGLQAMNAQSTIKYLGDLGIYVAAYTRLGTDPISASLRKQIDLSVSYDGREWSRVMQIDHAEPSGMRVNEPNIYDNGENIIVTYSITPIAGRYDLRALILKKSFLTGNPARTLSTFTTNPESGVYNTIAKTEFSLSEYPSSTFQNIIRGVTNISDTVEGPSKSYYNTVIHNRINGKSDSAFFSVEQALANFSAQTLIDSVELDSYQQLSLSGFSPQSILNGGYIGEYIALQIRGSNPLISTQIGKEYGIYQTHEGIENRFEGYINAAEYRLSSLNTAPENATDTGTTGEIRITSDYIYVCIATDTWVRAALTTW